MHYLQNPWVIGIGTAVIAGIILYFVLPKKGSVPKDSQTVIAGRDINDSIITRDVDIKIINPRPRPKIIEKQMTTMNVPYNGRCKTQISVTIAYPPSDDASIIPKGPANSICDLVPQRSGVRLYASGNVPYKSYLIVCITDGKAQEGDFDLSIR